MRAEGVKVGNVEILRRVLITMPATMKAAVLHGPGDIRCEMVQRPVPGPGEVLVNVKAAGVCGSDIPRVMVTGAYRHPLIPGHEFSGEVVEVGPGASSPGANPIRAGDRVTVVPCIPCRKCIYCERGNYFHCINYTYLGSRCDGGFAEYVKVPVTNVVRLPAQVDFELGAATEPVAVALHALRRAGSELAGSEVAVFGVGAIGALVAQCAVALGARRVFAVDVQRQKLDAVRALGIEATIATIDASREDAREVINSLTGGRGVDLAVEAAGSPLTFNTMVDAVRRMGSIVLIGRPGSEIRLSPDTYTTILRKEVSIAGTWGFEFTSYPHHDWETVLGFMERGEIKIAPLVTHRFRLDDAPKVFEMLKNKTEYFNKVLFITEDFG
ncbi:MAG: galactitol-1-phosphate 5-dehydrogenase [Firmicutes bacterium]|nr:galactitol-1-phosphate 5-dehydrogenase [Bacillota bacterium]